MSDILINQGGLYRCCLQALASYPEGWLDNLKDGSIISCQYCHAPIQKTGNIMHWVGNEIDKKEVPFVEPETESLG